MFFPLLYRYPTWNLTFFFIKTHRRVWFLKSFILEGKWHAKDLIHYFLISLSSKKQGLITSLRCKLEIIFLNISSHIGYKDQWTFKKSEGTTCCDGYPCSEWASSTLIQASPTRQPEISPAAQTMGTVLAVSSQELRSLSHVLSGTNSTSLSWE